MNEEFFTKADLLLRDRVTVNRYEHSLSVSQMAALLAEIYGVDIMYARIAGLLHDWDKCLSISTLRAIAKKYTDVPPSVRKHNAPTLHSFTAPWSLTQEFGAIPPEILQAVESHTTGNIRMSDLDKVIFIADILEPGRDFADIADLREMIGSATLDELFFQTYKRTVLYLVQADKMVHPNTFKVYNALIKQRREAEDVSDAYVGASTEIDVKLPRGVTGEALDSEDDFEDDFEGDEKDVVTSDSVLQDPVFASAPKQDEMKDTPVQDAEVSHVSQKASAKPAYAPLRDFLQGEDSKQTIQPKTNSIHRLGRLEDLLHDAPSATPAKSQQTVTQTADKKNP
ncbi:MAG: bis(5'-nucleosyl)-tetraphosphatase (symmetrical) YqeK, partial [Eggerthellaceae bacterium]|nr:bis(5'-nucleosyl)-tetraphosphatase (symmetrical) YqeK [Eggerthellaceae bacterium]